MNTKIFEACEAGDIKTVKYLFKKERALINIFYIMIAVDNGHLEVLKYFVEWGGYNPKNNYPFMSKPQFDRIVESGYDPKDNFIIIIASQNGYLDIVKYLVEIGCDPTIQNNSAIQLASYNGHLEVVKYLVSVGSHPTDCNNLAIHANS